MLEFNYFIILILNIILNFSFLLLVYPKIIYFISVYLIFSISQKNENLKIKLALIFLSCISKLFFLIISFNNSAYESNVFILNILSIVSDFILFFFIYNLLKLNIIDKEYDKNIIASL